MIRSINRIHLVGLAGSVAYTVLALYSRTPAGPSLVVFYGCVGAAALGLWVVWRWAKTVSVTWPMVFTWALLFRAIGLFGDPIFEDDFYRYLWDGYRTVTVSDPYGVAPEAFFADPAVPARFQTILGQINYPEVPTIYGPVLQWLFALGYVIAPGEVWPLKLLLCLADVALLRLLARLAPPGQVLLYAWNPLVIKEIAFTAHSDGLMPLFLIAAWFCTRAHQPLRAAGLLAIAVAVKLPALLLLPFLLRWKSWKSVAVFGITLAGLYLPLVPRGASDWAGLKVFANHWEFNPALFGLLTLTVDPSLARWLLAGTVLSCVAALFLRSRGLAQQGALPRGDLILGTLVLCSPVINPWYWLWVLPFSVVYPSRWSWTAAIALLAAYVTGLNLNGVDLGAYEQPLWVRWIEFGVIAVAGAADVLKPKLDRKWAGKQIRSRRLEEGPHAGGPAALDSTLAWRLN